MAGKAKENKGARLYVRCPVCKDHSIPGNDPTCTCDNGYVATGFTQEQFEW